ncbi:small integral membrane protein 26-like [Pungitius pungitius]|uniref:small integral membrane protein 26-like n=1 Tax=Pungitius pungitius TaxID=134920 RepID=UPI001887AB63|nr:small integral membrane protein 26-like [Pungitius pungitius]
MKLKTLMTWNLRVSAVYAVGIWTMLGSYSYYRYMRPKDDTPEVLQEPRDPNEHVHQTAYSKTVIIYKKDFVPYTTRIYNFLRSFSGEPGSGDGNK